MPEIYDNRVRALRERVPYLLRKRHPRAMLGGSHHECSQALPSVLPSKRLRDKGKIQGLLRKIGGLNRPQGRLDRHSSASHGDD
jgi:hypothetical protein